MFTGRDGHLREPSVEAVELLGQNDRSLPVGVMVDVAGLGLGVYRGSIDPTFGPRQHYMDYPGVGRHPSTLKVPQQRFRGRGASDHPNQQNWAVARVPQQTWLPKMADTSLLNELTEAIGGRYRMTIDPHDDDEAEAEGPLGFGSLVPTPGIIYITKATICESDSGSKLCIHIPRSR